MQTSKKVLSQAGRNATQLCVPETANGRTGAAAQQKTVYAMPWPLLMLLNAWSSQQPPGSAYDPGTVLLASQPQQQPPGIELELNQARQAFAD
jgi:hypothetical protein